MRTRSIPLIVVAVLLVLAAGIARADTITVTGPIGGTLLLGSPQNITWTYSGAPGSQVFVIRLFKDNAKLGTIVTNTGPLTVTANGFGSFSLPWVVGNYIGGVAAPGSGYRIRVKVAGSPIVGDGVPFSIAPLKKLGPDLMEKARMRKPEPPEPPKPNLRIALSRTPADCGTQESDACPGISWQAFSVILENAGAGSGTGHTNWLLDLYYWGKTGNQDPGDNAAVAWWRTGVNVPQPHGSDTYTESGQTMGTLAQGTQLRIRMLPSGKWILKAQTNLPLPYGPLESLVEETTKGDNTDEVVFWVK